MNTTHTHSTPAPALVLGARGRLGGALVRAFAQAGWPVVAHTRRLADAPPMPGVRWADALLEDPAALAAAASGAVLVVHALNPSSYTRAAWQRDVLPFMHAAIGAARQLGATLMFPGNVYGFGAAMPPVLNEDTPMRPSTEFGLLRVAAEAELAAAAARGELRAVVLRAGDFFGAGRGTWLDLMMAPRLRHGVVTLPTRRTVATPWAYLPDLAQTFVRVAERRAELPAFAALHFAGHTLTGDDWVTQLTLAARARGWLREGATLRVKTVPWPLLRLAAPLHGLSRGLVDMRYLHETPHRLCHERLRALIGAEPHTPFEPAMRAALADVLG